MKHFTRKLKKCIFHYFDYQLNQTKKHKSYENFRLVQTIFEIFHTLTINFIFVFLKQKHEFDCIIFIICKFSKKIIVKLNKHLKRNEMSKFFSKNNIELKYILFYRFR